MSTLKGFKKMAFQGSGCRKVRSNFIVLPKIEPVIEERFHSLDNLNPASKAARANKHSSRDISIQPYISVRRNIRSHKKICDTKYSSVIKQLLSQSNKSAGQRKAKNIYIKKDSMENDSSLNIQQLWNI